MAERSREMAKAEVGTRLKRGEESVCYKVFGVRDVDYIAGEFGDEG